MGAILDYLRSNWQYILTGLLGLNFIALCSLIFALRTNAKENLLKDIVAIINSCRGCSSFDERSESKLIQWLEGSEDMLHRKSMWDLWRIRREMGRYLVIHNEMADGVPFGTYHASK